MPSELHEQQNRVAARWAKSKGFSVVVTNMHAAGSRERVDVIAFRQTASLMIESKVSRSDFALDKKKPERNIGGVGTYRFYITPPGLVHIDEVPFSWGLLYCHGRKMVEIKYPSDNLWPPYGHAGNEEWKQFQHGADIVAEHAMLFSLARRRVRGISEF